MCRPASRGPRRFLLLVLLGYWLLATPLGADALLGGLGHGFTPLASREAAQGADTIVLLGGGAETFSADGAVLGQLAPNSALRVLEAARVYRLIGARLVIASGGVPYPKFQLKPESEMLQTALIQVGVPPNIIVQESASRTTRDEARLLRPMLEARGVQRFVLVTAAPHMRRALNTFRAEGLNPVPSVSRMRSEHVAPSWLLWPNEESLRFAGMAIYDYAALLYYWWNGWTAVSGPVASLRPARPPDAGPRCPRYAMRVATRDRS
jgi:uncharacterized SAM-binding protein YcdF (DUF218 family)